jgi:hypothetical protein
MKKAQKKAEKRGRNYALLPVKLWDGSALPVPVELEDGSVLRLCRIRTMVYCDILRDDRLLQRELFAMWAGGKLITLGVAFTEPGDGIKRPSRPCPDCGGRMEHQPDKCTYWLPNGTYRCRDCGSEYLGAIGIVGV